MNTTDRKEATTHVTNVEVVITPEATISPIEDAKVLINENSEDEQNTEIRDEITTDEAVELVEKYILDNNIQIPYTVYNVHYFYTNQHDNINYYVIRLYYTDPNNKDFTETISRYWVNANNGEILKENLWTGELNKETFN